MRMGAGPGWATPDRSRLTRSDTSADLNGLLDGGDDGVLSVGTEVRERIANLGRGSSGEARRCLLHRFHPPDSPINRESTGERHDEKG